MPKANRPPSRFCAWRGCVRTTTKPHYGGWAACTDTPPKSHHVRRWGEFPDRKVQADPRSWLSQAERPLLDIVLVSTPWTLFVLPSGWCVVRAFGVRALVKVDERHAILRGPLVER